MELCYLSEEVELKFLDDETVPFNSLYDTFAAVYHGNGPSKVIAYVVVHSVSSYHNFICSCS